MNDRAEGRVVKALRAAVVLLAAGMLIAAIIHPAFRHPEGHLGVRFCLVLSCAIAVAVAGLAAGTRWAKAALWFALALIGQSVALQMIHAGMMVGHQHYVPLSGLLSRPYAPELIFVAVQMLVIAYAGARHAREWFRTLISMVGPIRLAVACVVFILTSATLSRSLSAYFGELALASLIQAINLLTVLLAVASLPADAIESLQRRFDRVLGWNTERARSDLFVVLPALWVLIAGAVLAWFVYQNHPHVPDEVVYLYPARYFARGMLSMPLPPVPAAFELDLMTYEAARWYSPVPLGWPAALSIGAFLGVPWLVNPVLNAINVVLAYLLFRDLYDRPTARLATLLLCASPWFIFMGMNFMTHTFTLTCALAAAIMTKRLRDNGSLAWSLPAGIAIGVMGMIRPLEGLTVAVLLALWVLGRFPWSGGAVVRVFMLALAAIATASLTLPYNAHLAGDPLTFPLMAYTDSTYGVGTNALGFGANRGLGWPGLDPFPGHGLIDVLINGNLNTYSVNVELFGWSIGSLLLLTLLLLSRRLARVDVWMIITLAAIVGVHSFYWFSGGPDFGARYWYLILIPCVGLTARSVEVLTARIAEARSAGSTDSQAHSPDDVRTRVHAFVLVLAVIALVSFFPWRALDKYYHYRNMRPDVRRLAAENDFGRSLVLVRGKRHPDYASAAIYNPIDLTADAPIYVWDRDPAITRDVLRAYEDRKVWILDGPTRTGGSFRIVGGPLPASTLLNTLPRP